MALQPASTATLSRYLVSGYWSETGSVAHSFDASASNVISVNLAGLDAAGRALARAALDAWEAVADIAFQEVTSGGRITFDDEQSGAFCSASYYNTGDMHSAQVNVSTSWLSAYGSQVGGYAFQTYMHEIGHALGLGHSGAYNGSASFETGAKFTNDSWQQTLMSYFDQDENTAVDATRAYCLTPMTADILAIQQIYGAAAGGVTGGNTTYGMGSSLGSYLDAAFRGTTGSLAHNALTVWDAGGIDTINLGNDARAQEVNLAAGSFSSVYGLRGNLGIALGTTIENFVAGAGSDRVSGNTAANTLRLGTGHDKAWGGGGTDKLLGGGGNDSLAGGAGSDRLIGGAGMDDFVFSTASHSAGRAQDTILDFARGADDIVVAGVDARMNIAGNQAFVLDAGGSFSAGEVRQVALKQGLLLQFNTDGDATAEMSVLLQGVTSALGTSDFVL